MVYAAPSLRLFLLPSLSRFRFGFLEVSARALAEVSAARGGDDGGEGSPELTSGIPLCPAGAGSGVMESREIRRVVYDIAAGEHRCLLSDSLAMTITTTMTVVFLTGSHCFVGLPRLRFLKGFDGVEERSLDDVCCDWKDMGIVAVERLQWLVLDVLFCRISGEVVVVVGRVL